MQSIMFVLKKYHLYNIQCMYVLVSNPQEIKQSKVVSSNPTHDGSTRYNIM